MHMYKSSQQLRLSFLAIGVQAQQILKVKFKFLLNLHSIGSKFYWFHSDPPSNYYLPLSNSIFSYSLNSIVQRNLTECES